MRILSKPVTVACARWIRGKGGPPISLQRRKQQRATYSLRCPIAPSPTSLTPAFFSLFFFSLFFSLSYSCSIPYASKEFFFFPFFLPFRGSTTSAGMLRAHRKRQNHHGIKTSSVSTGASTLQYRHIVTYLSLHAFSTWPLRRGGWGVGVGIKNHIQTFQRAIGVKGVKSITSFFFFF